MCEEPDKPAVCSYGLQLLRESAATCVDACCPCCHPVFLSGIQSGCMSDPSTHMERAAYTAVPIALKVTSRSTPNKNILCHLLHFCFHVIT